MNSCQYMRLHVGSFMPAAAPKYLLVLLIGMRVQSPCIMCQWTFVCGGLLVFIPISYESPTGAAPLSWWQTFWLPEGCWELICTEHTQVVATTVMIWWTHWTIRGEAAGPWTFSFDAGHTASFHCSTVLVLHGWPPTWPPRWLSSSLYKDVVS